MSTDKSGQDGRPSSSSSRPTSPSMPSASRGADLRLLLDLPSEIQQQVAEHLSNADLLQLQLASKECHVLASREIWQENEFYLEGRLPHYPNTGSAFRLMAALETLVCSDHDYAQYIRHLGLLGHPSSPMPASHTQLYKIRYAAGTPGQQSLNINLLTVLRKAKSLESFLLEAPLELSEPVWLELARKESLLYLCVSLNGRVPWSSDHRHLELLTTDMSTALPSGGQSYRHIGKCANLKELSLLHLNELEYLDQIAACIRSSSGTLTYLQLSLSEQLYEKAKKPSAHQSLHPPGLPPPAPIEFEDQEDDESYMSLDDAQPVPDPNLVQAENETIRKNKAEQEAALARILSVEVDKVDKVVEKALKKSAEESAVLSARPSESEIEMMLDTVKKVFEDASNMNAEQLGVLDKIASRIQLLNSHKKPKTSKSSPKQPKAPKQKPKKYTPVVASSSQPKDGGSWILASPGGPISAVAPPAMENLGLPAFDMPMPLPLPVPNPYHISDLGPASGWPMPGSSSSKKLTQLSKKAHKVPLPPPVAKSSSSTSEPSTSSSEGSVPLPASPKEPAPASYEDMNIDIEHPDEISGESGDDQEMIDEQAPSIPAQDVKGKGKGKAKETIPSAQFSPAKRSLSESHRDDVADKDKKDRSPDEIMKDWIRENHGLALRSFHVYLIPVKASIVGRALRLPCLTDLVLLSVGGQGPLWQMLGRAQEETPLALKKIHTDDVSKAFLDCVSKLQGLTKLVLRRRAKKDKFSTTSKEPATIEEIRKHAVQPHMSTLRVLAIQNDQDASWCLTQELIGLVCARAAKLEQFAFQAGSSRYIELLRLSRKPSALPSLSSMYLISSGVDRPGMLAGGSIGITHAPPPPLSIGSGSLGPNGEPYDVNHNNFLSDNYRNCIHLTKEWASSRKESGDRALRYIAVHTTCVRVSDPKKPSHKDHHPTWLKEEYDALQGALPPGGQMQPFDRWAADHGPANGDAPQASFKTIRGMLPTDGGEIFSVEVMHAKLI